MACPHPLCYRATWSCRQNINPHWKQRENIDDTPIPIFDTAETEDSMSIEETTVQITKKCSEVGTKSIRKKHKYSWKFQYSTRFPWIEYNTQAKEVWCSYPHCKSRYNFFKPLWLICDRWKYLKLESRLFIQHENTKLHRKRRHGYESSRMG